MVIVGGQALTLWARYYLFDELTGKELLLAASDDIDFYGGPGSIEFLEKKLNEHFTRTTLDDHTPHLAELTLMIEGEKIPIDVLKDVAGLEKSHIQHALYLVDAITSEVAVIDPICCIRSRLYNLYAGFTKREHREREHTRVWLAIRCSRLFIQDTYEVDGFTAIRRNLREIRELALSKRGMDAYLQYGIDILQALPHPESLTETPDYGSSFLKVTTDQVAAKRARLKTHWQKIGKHLYDPEEALKLDPR